VKNIYDRFEVVRHLVLLVRIGQEPGRHELPRACTPRTRYRYKMVHELALIPVDQDAQKLPFTGPVAVVEDENATRADVAVQILLLPRLLVRFERIICSSDQFEDDRSP